MKTDVFGNLSVRPSVRHALLLVIYLLYVYPIGNSKQHSFHNGLLHLFNCARVYPVMLEFTEGIRIRLWQHNISFFIFASTEYIFRGL